MTEDVIYPIMFKWKLLKDNAPGPTDITLGVSCIFDNKKSCNEDKKLRNLNGMFSQSILKDELHESDRCLYFNYQFAFRIAPIWTFVHVIIDFDKLVCVK